MTRDYSDCCHYDEGYDEGYADGREESVGGVNTVADALKLFAREAFVGGDLAASELLDRLAERVVADGNFRMRMEIEKERQASIVAAYAEARKAAA